jgi:hypothetical protein
LGQREPPGVERHADLGVGAELVQGGDVLRRGHAPGDGDLGVPGGLDQGGDLIEVGAPEAALALDEGDQKPADVGAKLGHTLDDPAPGAFSPALDDDLTVPGVQGGDHALFGELREQLRRGRRAQDHLRRPGVEPTFGGLDAADAAADPGLTQPADLLDERGVVALAHGGVEVDDGDLTHPAKLGGDGAWIPGVERLLRAADELNGLAPLKVDGRDDHRRSSRPKAASASLTAPTVVWPS